MSKNGKGKGIVNTDSSSTTATTTTEKKWLKESWAKPSLPKLSNKDNFIRCSDGCYEIINSEAWGTTIIKIEDPEAGQTLTYKEKTDFKLIENFPKIPKEIWSAWIDIVFHFCEEPKSKHGPHTYYGGGTDDNEVSVVFLRHEDDLTRWKAVIPKQVVSTGAVDANFKESCDILTGEKYNVFPPIGWLHVGSSHSHNTMSAFFSSTDDRSELGIPGIHIVVGKIDKAKMTYEYKSSIVLKGQRKIIDELADVVDCTPHHSPFHPECLELVKEKETIVVISSSGYSGQNSSGSYGGRPSFGFDPFRGGYGRSNRTYKEGALWDNDESEWIYPDDLALMNDDDDEVIIMLPGDTGADSYGPDADADSYSADGNDVDSSNPNIPYTPYGGAAFDDYCRLTSQEYDEVDKKAKEKAKEDFRKAIGRELNDQDEEWLNYFLQGVSNKRDDGFICEDGEIDFCSALTD